MELPTSGYFLYSKSKCKYCTKAKELLPAVTVINVDHLIEKNKKLFLENVEKIAETEVKTFPIVFYNGIFIGGFTESQEHFTLIKN